MKAAATPTPPDHAPGLEIGFDGGPFEGPLEIEGTLPPLRGCLYQNRPAGFRRGPFAYRHWLDGDGLVSRLEVGDGPPRFTSRFVATRKRQQEEAAGAPVYRTFGTAFPGDRLRFGLTIESTASIHVQSFGGRLLAFGEQGLPWELDPATLATRGEFDFGRALGGLSPFSAHGKLFEGELHNFGVEYHPTRPQVHLYRFQSSGTPRFLARHPLDLPRAPHDFALTPRYFVLYLPPHVLDLGALSGRGQSVLDSLDWRPDRPLKILVASREDGSLARRFQLPARYGLHLVNAFETADAVALDLFEYDAPLYGQFRDFGAIFSTPLRGELTRLHLDPVTGGARREPLGGYDRMPDFPTILPESVGRPHRHLWILGCAKAAFPGRKFYDELLHHDAERGTWSRHRARDGSYFCGDPIPARDAAGRWWLWLSGLEQGRGSWWILDAFAVERGPVARLRLPAPSPFALHGCFVSP